MKQNLFLTGFALLCMLILTNCSVDDSKFESDLQNSLSEVADSHVIPMETAISNLEDFLKLIEPVSTKAGVSGRSIDTVEPVSLKSIATRGSAGSNIDALLYLVNFADDQGFALLSGDDRVDAEVLAVTDSGSMTQEQLIDAIDDEDEETGYVNPYYPTDGPGILYSADSTEMYINPNTFDSYCEEVDDYFIGDYEEIYSDVEAPGFGEIIGDILDYITYQITTYSNNDTTNGDLDYTQGTDPDVWREEKSQTDTIAITENYLKAFKYWGQDSPFNSLFKTFKNGNQAATGCFPLAIAKVMTKFEYPDTYTYNGSQVDWDRLQDKSSSDFSESTAAVLLYSIAERCNAWYFKQGTFVFPYRAVSFLKKYGFQNVDKIKYNTDAVETALNSGTPIIIFAIPTGHFFGMKLRESHAWNIDGYVKYQRTTTVNWYKVDELINTQTYLKKWTMVHCDFGWNSICNGYFLSGTFNSSDSNVKWDNNSHDESFNYKYDLKTIIYDNPKPSNN